MTPLCSVLAVAVPERRMPAGPDPTHPLRSVLSSSSSLPCSSHRASSRLLKQSCPRAFASAVPAACHAYLHPPGRCLHPPPHPPFICFLPDCARCTHGNRLQDGFRQGAEPGLPCVPLGEVQAREKRTDSFSSFFNSVLPERSVLSLHTLASQQRPGCRSSGEGKSAGKMPQINKQHFPRGRHRAGPLVYYPFRRDRPCLDGRSTELAPGRGTFNTGPR